MPNSLARYEAAIQRGGERSLKLLQDTRKQRREAENTALRFKADFPATQAGQGFPDEKREAESASRAGDERVREGRGGEVAETTETSAGVAPEAATKPKPVRYRMEQRVYKNSRYEVRVPIEE